MQVKNAARDSHKQQRIIYTEKNYPKTYYVLRFIRRVLAAA